LLNPSPIRFASVGNFGILIFSESLLDQLEMKSNLSGSLS